MSQLPGFFEARFGGIKLWASEISWSAGRDVVTHKLTRGNMHPKQDRGRADRVARVSLQFDEMDGDDLSPRERLEALEAVIADGEPQVFQHPLAGAYLARIGAFDPKVDASSIVTAEMEIFPEEEPRAVTPVGFGTAAVSADGVVAAAAGNAETQLAAIGATSPVIDKARAADTAWQVGVNTRTVLNDVAQLSSEVNEEIERLGLETDMKKWQAFKAFIALSDSILSSARAVTSDVAQIFTMKISRSISLNVLLARIYGGADVETRRVQVLSLNDIRTPGWLTVGIELRLPTPPRVLARLG
jgi:hypothetical protein